VRHNGLVCANYLSIAGYKVRVIEAQDVAGGGAVTSEFATGFKVSGLAHLFHGLDPQILKDIGLQSTDFELGPEVKTIALAANGNHLLIGKDSVIGEALSEEDKHAYKEFKQEYYGFAKALKPLLLNKPGRLKNMDRADKFTFVKMGWGLRFGLGVDAMREFLRVGGINIYDVLKSHLSNEGFLFSRSAHHRY
jgi:phytoene dehydrogenase-like protein